MSGAERCDQILHLIDRVLGEIGLEPTLDGVAPGLVAPDSGGGTMEQPPTADPLGSATGFLV